MPERPADLILLNGRIYPLGSDAEPRPALALGDGRILAVGSDSQVRRHFTLRTETLDLQGATVLPGLVDSHVHLEGLGKLLDQINLIKVPSYAQLVEAVRGRASAQRAGSWVLGRGWDSSIWPGGRLPEHAALSEAAPNHPVWLKRRDGHSGLANALALKAAGIARDTQDPPGGEILRNAAGEPTGVLADNAMDLVERRLPVPGVADYQRWFTIAQEECLRQGLTGVHDAGITAGALNALKVMTREEMLALRVYGMFWDPDADRVAEYVQRNSPFVRMGREGMLSLRAIKLYMDGSLGSHTAWMLRPYHDRPGHDGLNLLAKDRLLEIAQEALLRGYQVCAHAIGDRANRELLDAYELIQTELVEGDHRLRIEHAQFLSEEDIPRFGLLGVVASVQPSHAIADMKMVYERLGPDGHPGAYAWARLRDAGAPLALGSDFPFERVSPIWSIYCSIARQDEAGRPSGGWMPEMRLTAVEAIHASTAGAAYASFQEDELGTLSPGRLADLTILSEDPFHISPAGVLKTEIIGTIVHGRFRHRSGL